mgnify:CR=1 FL=1
MKLRKCFKLIVFVFCFFTSALCVVHAEGLYDNFGFNSEGVHEITGERYNVFDFDKNGKHKNGTMLDDSRRDVDGYINGVIYDYKAAVARCGKDGFNRRGFNVLKNIHRKTGTAYDPEGFDRFGFNEVGINKYTGTRYDATGYDKEGMDQRGYPKYRPGGVAPLPPRIKP